MTKDSERWPPKQCDMPDLSKLPGKNIQKMILNKFFRGGGPKDHVAYVLYANFIRLSDQALQEYNYARLAYLEYLKHANDNNLVIGLLLRATGHLETCLTYVKRSSRFAEKLRANNKSPNIPRDLSVLSASAQKRINYLRNAIEHLDEKILDGKVPPGQPIHLMLKSDSIELLGVEIFYHELAQWLKNLHDLSSDLAGYQEDVKLDVSVCVTPKP